VPPASAESGREAQPGESDKPRRFRPVKLRGVQDTKQTAPAPTPGAASAPSREPGVDVDDLLSRFMPGATPHD
jgi:hypothetical protein